MCAKSTTALKLDQQAQFKWSLLLVFPLFPSSFSNGGGKVEGVLNQQQQDKARVEKPRQKKKVMMPHFPIIGFPLAVGRAGNRHGGEAQSLF